MAPFNAIPPLAARKGMTFDAVDFLLLFPPHCTFYIRKPIDVLCAHLGPSFFFFFFFVLYCGPVDWPTSRRTFFPPPVRTVKIKWEKKGEAKSCLHFGQNSLVELTALLTRPHVYFLHNTSSNSLSFFKKNRFTLTFRVFYPLLPEQFRTLKASDVLMM